MRYSCYSSSVGVLCIKEAGIQSKALAMSYSQPDLKPLQPGRSCRAVQRLTARGCSPFGSGQMRGVKRPLPPAALPDSCARRPSREQPLESLKTQGEGGPGSFVTVINARSSAAPAPRVALGSLKGDQAHRHHTASANPSSKGSCPSVNFTGPGLSRPSAERSEGDKGKAEWSQLGWRHGFHRLRGNSRRLQRKLQQHLLWLWEEGLLCI